jgi:N-acetylglucosaminyldiphosphoundecaprenol N-acetyl-beta-D-mannosaminyltransferase
MLGGPEGLTEKAIARLRAHVPKLNVVGTHHGYFAKAGPENDSVIGMINRTSPDVMWIGMGMPLQEKWILENYTRLNVKLFMTCGAAFEYIAGTVSRCPQWMGDMGLEWLFRFMQNPRRMNKRYLWGNPVFLVDALLERLGVIKY